MTSKTLDWVEGNYYTEQGLRIQMWEAFPWVILFAPEEPEFPYSLLIEGKEETVVVAECAVLEAAKEFAYDLHVKMLEDSLGENNEEE